MTFDENSTTSTNLWIRTVRDDIGLHVWQEFGTLLASTTCSDKSLLCKIVAVWAWFVKKSAVCGLKMKNVLGKGPKIVNTKLVFLREREKQFCKISTQICKTIDVDVKIYQMKCKYRCRKRYHETNVNMDEFINDFLNNNQNHLTQNQNLQQKT